MTPDTISALLEAIPLPSVLVAQGERVLGVNGRATALLGPGITGRHFITALRQPAILDAIETCLRDGTTTTTRYLSRDGAQDTAFHVTCSRIDAESVHGVLVCFEDVTHLEQAGQMRRDFVANVSHELRTPLTALLGFIETLRGPAKNDAQASERFLATMQEEAQRMERLVRDLLSLSRVESQERLRPTDPVDLAHCAGAAAHSLERVAAEADVTIATDLPGTPVMVPGDADQLRQVVTNLVENAIKYGGPGKTVHLSVRPVEREPAVRGPAAVLSVRDEGPGIDPVHIPRLTERFYRVDSHRSRQMGGTGLGLAIVKHIVNRHRGRLRIESAPGQGAEFRIILPSETGGLGR